MPGLPDHRSDVAPTVRSILPRTFDWHGSAVFGFTVPPLVDVEKATVVENLELKIIERPIAQLRPRENNPRTHSKKQLRKIADSIQEFGFVTPILIDEHNMVIAGHGRLEAAKTLKLSVVPTLSLSHLTEAQVRAYVIADNKLAALAGWDKEFLAIEMAEISSIDIDFDLTITGFEIEELDLLDDVRGSATEHANSDFVEPDRTRNAISQKGDLWLCGTHRLLCGNSLDANSYAMLMGSERADMVITDPPYNVRINGHVSGLGSQKHEEFAMASGEMSREAFQRFLSAMCRQMAAFSRSGSLHFIFMDWRSIADLIGAGEEHYTDLVNLIVWVKSNGGMGTLYRSQHELAVLFKKGNRPHRNNVALGANGRYRTNVWQYPGMTSFSAERDASLASHPTVKNGDMIADAIRDVTDKGDLILDPFAGSGTTLFAAEQSGRKARLIELDEHYCDAILARAIKAGLTVTHGADGRSFEEIKLDRTAKLTSPGEVGGPRQSLPCSAAAADREPLAVQGYGDRPASFLDLLN